MKKIHTGKIFLIPKEFHKFLLIMKLSFIFLFFIIFNLSATVYSQKFSVDIKDQTIREVLKTIELQSNYRFFYNDLYTGLNNTISLKTENNSVTELLGQIFNNQLISFTILENNMVVIAPRELMKQQKVTGIVTDVTTNEPIIGANVVIEGTTIGVVTDVNGKFSLDISKQDAVLLVSFVGYNTEHINVGGQSVLDIKLVPDITKLNEIVVVGYGTQRKKDITSAVSIIDLKGVGDMVVSNASKMLQGQAAGVVVKQSSGTPGEQMNITIRGVGSLGAGSNPLYVIDGFAVGTEIGQNLNPNDIESISILKDAASSAIYGARGSNGVVLITTKSAKDKESELTFTANYGIQNVPDSRRIKMMNGLEFANFLKESWLDKKRYFENREPSNDEVPIGIRNPEQTKYSTDWVKEIMNQNAPFQEYNLQMASGTGKIKSLISAGYLNQQGGLKATNFERYSLRANVTGKINNHILAGFNIVGARTGGGFVDSNGRDKIFGRALWADPRDPVYNDDGTYNTYIGGRDGVFGTANPVQERDQFSQKQFINDLTSNAFVEISFLKDFKFKSSINANVKNLRRNDFRPSTLAGTDFNNPPPQDASLKEWYQTTLTTSADQLLSYFKTINDHQIEAMVGYSAQESTFRELYAEGSKFGNDQVRFMDNAQTKKVTSQETSWSMLAYFARINYSYKNKYLLSASYRREGSSRFGINNKYGDFPAVSIGWRISQEPFMSDVSWIKDLKLRGSYGVTGNNDIGEYKNASTLGSAGYIFGNTYASGVYTNSFVNNNIGWEQSNQLDLGLDLSVFDNKLVFTAEYYKKTTNNMLLSVSIPVITGFNNSYTNVGKVENSGLELAANYKTKITNDLNFRCNFNISFNRNKVLAIDGQNDALWSGDFYDLYNVSKVGRPIGMITGFKVLGIFQTDAEVKASPTQDGAIPGVYKYLDGDGNGTISYDTKDMVEIGNPWPKYTWGLTLGLDYKNFDLNILSTGAMKYDLFRQIEKTTMNMDGVFNVLQSGVNRFRSTAQPGDGVGPTSNTWKWERESNSRYVYDASHLWVKSISLGYTLPNAARILKGTRIYITADNLLLVTKYPGSNPDINTSNDSKRPGWDDEAYPVPRTFTIGANIKFK